MLPTDLIAELDRILTETNLSGSYLKLVITESALMENTESAFCLLQQVRQRYIQLSIPGLTQITVIKSHRQEMGKIFPLLPMKLALETRSGWVQLTTINHQP